MPALDKISKSRTWPFVAMAGILILGFALRAYRLSEESPWWDEIVTLGNLDAPGMTDFIERVRAEDPPMTPVYFLLAFLWSGYTSTDTIDMRLLSVVLGLGTILLMFWAGRLLYGPRAGLIAAWAQALSLVHIYYSQEVRVYALVTLLATLSMGSFIVALNGMKGRWWFIHLMCNFLLTFTHLFTPLLFAAQGMFLLMFRNWNRPLIVVWGLYHVLLGAILALWLNMVDLSSVHEAASWMVAPGFREIVMFLLIFGGGRPTNENPSSHLPTGVSLDVMLAGLLVAIVLWFVAHTLFLKDEAKEPENPTALTEREKLALLLLWGIVPVAGLLAASFVWRPCFVCRYVLYSSMPLYLLLGGALDRVPRWGVRAALGVALTGLTLYQASGLLVGPFRPDWQSASRYLENETRETDKVIVFQSLNLTALEFNSKVPRNQMECAGVWSEIADKAAKARTEGRSSWLVVWLWSDPAKIERSLLGKGMQFTHKDFPGWPNLRVYEIPAMVQPPSGG